MNALFSDSIHDFLVIFIDDRLTYSDTWKVTLVTTTSWESTWKRTTLYVGKSKYNLATWKVEFLGAQAGADGIRTSEDRRKVVQHFNVFTLIM